MQNLLKIITKISKTLIRSERILGSLLSRCTLISVHSLSLSTFSYLPFFLQNWCMSLYLTVAMNDFLFILSLYLIINPIFSIMNSKHIIQILNDSQIKINTVNNFFRSLHAKWQSSKLTLGGCLFWNLHFDRGKKLHKISYQLFKL